LCISGHLDLMTETPITVILKWKAQFLWITAISPDDVWFEILTAWLQRLLARNQQDASDKTILTHTLRFLRCRQYILPKRRWVSTEVNSDTSQDMVSFPNVLLKQMH
jgi:hypothetical protein